jgi:hypothetical protein
VPGDPATRALMGFFLLFVMANGVVAQPLVVTVEAPAVQQSSLSTDPSAFRASNVITETFDELKPGFISKPVPFAGNPALGSYDHLLVRSADAFGGAAGIGAYMMVAAMSTKLPTQQR